MNKIKITPYLAFLFLCIAYGSSSALVVVIRKKVDPLILSSVRMFFGFLTSLLIFLYKTLSDHKYSRHIRQSIASHSTNFRKGILCGVINYGFPYSLVAISQRSVSTIAVQISQPFVPIFSLIGGHFLTIEKCSIQKFSFQFISVIGTVLSSIPTFLHSEIKESSFIIDYFLLLISTVSFGFGAVFLKYFQSKADQILLCVFQLFGAFLYSILYGFFSMGPKQFISKLKEIEYDSLFEMFILGVFYTCFTSHCVVYTMKNLGMVAANYTNVGQIIIGILIGVTFLGEWDEYSAFDIFISIVGLVVLFISIVFGMKNETKTSKEEEGADPLLQKI